MFALFDDINYGHVKLTRLYNITLQINEERNDDTTRIYFSHHITAWVIKGKLSSVSGDGKVQIKFRARKTPGM